MRRGLQCVGGDPGSPSLVHKKPVKSRLSASQFVRRSEPRNQQRGGKTEGESGEMTYLGRKGHQQVEK